MSAPRLLILILVVFAMLDASSARAQSPQGPTPAELATARRLFTEAQQHIENKEWREAETKLRAAQEIKNTAGLAFHVALAQEQQGRLLQALWSYLDANDLIEQGANEPDVAELVGPALERLEQQIPKLTLECASPCPAREILIDRIQRNTGAVNQPIQLDPGKHTIAAYDPDDRKFEAVIELAAGDRKSLEIRFPERASAPAAGAVADAPPAVETASSSNGKLPLVATLAGVTVIALATGIGFGVAAGDSDDLYEKRYRELAALSPPACDDPANAGRCREMEDALEDRDRQRSVERAMYITAGVTGAATLAVWFLWPSGSTESKTSSGVSVAPSSAGTLGAFIAGWF